MTQQLTDDLPDTRSGATDATVATTGTPPHTRARAKLLDLSLTQLLGGSMAAATAAALGSRLGVVGNSAIMNVEPVFALALGWLILGQAIAPVQVVEVAAYGGSREVEPGREIERRRRPVLEDRPGHPLARGTLVDRAVEFHNIIVSLLPDSFQLRLP